MHHFIFPTQTTWISSGSSTIDGTSFKDQNFGRDQILEVKKEFYNSSFNYQTRALVNFSGTEFTELSKSVADGTIASDAKYYLKLYEAEGNSDIQTDYKLAIQPLSQSWVEGTGKFGDSPKNTNGCSWENRSNPIGGNPIAWTGSLGGSPLSSSDNPFESSSVQSFSNESPDVNVEVTDMVKSWLSGSSQLGGFENNGMLIRFSGSQETDSTTFGNLKFFSRHTHTIYSPKLEVRWDDSSFDSDATGSLNELTMSGLADNYLYMRGLRESYKENDRVKFRVGARKRYIQKTFSNSVQTLTGSYFPSNSGSYAIKDIATDEYIIPFSAYTSMSLDTEGLYFNQWLDGFYSDRAYKILLKLKYNDGQEQIFDDDFEFIIKRS
tara:strand:+ start:1819 stop:2958 length:1140 start_codon:yes stop_codon:yes gene_type:complete